MNSIVTKINTPKSVTVRSIPPPGYTATLAILPPVRGLRKELGSVDASSQITQLAFEIFRANVIKEPDPLKFIIAKSREYNLPPGSVNMQSVNHLLATSHIVHANAVIDALLSDLCEITKLSNPNLKSSWKTKKRANDTSYMDPLDQLAENLPEKSSQYIRQKPEFLLMHYYRHVRNMAAHRDPQTLKKAAKAFSFIDEDYFFRNYELRPNPPHAVNFSDFLIYVRATKYYSLILNDACNVDAEKILNLLFLEKNVRLKISKYLGAKNESNRTNIHNLLVGTYQTIYGMRPKNAYMQFKKIAAMLSFKEIEERMATK